MSKETNNLSKAFLITSVCRNDLKDQFTKRQIDSLTDEDMEDLAENMAECYMNDGGFWDAMEIVTSDILADKKNK